MVDIKCIYNGSDSLGESPLWDPNQQKLFWIDINNCLIHCLDPSSQTIQTWKCPSKIGFIVRAKKGRLIAGLREGFFYFSPITGMFEKIFDPEPEKEKNRLNDGKVDRKGRLWCGSMQDPNPDRSSGALYRFTEGGTCTRVLNEIQVPNSIAWSPDNLTMYFSDTREEVIWSFDVTLKTGDRIQIIEGL